MSYDVRPDEASQALDEIQQRQARVISETMIPTWFYGAVGASNVALAVGVDIDRPVTVVIGVVLFGLGIAASVGWVAVTTARRAQPHNRLLGPLGILAIAALPALVVGVSVPVAFAADAAGWDYAATAGTLVGFVLMVICGPVLNRLLRRIMLANRTGRRLGAQQ
jgi:hypothetical protein